MAVVVEYEVQACDELWFSPEDLMDEHDDLELEDAELIIREATSALWMLTHERFHGVRCFRDTYKLWPSQRRLHLAQSPVLDVQSVASTTACGDPGDEVAGWCLQPDGKISFPRASSLGWGDMGCVSGQTYVTVDYTVSSNLPIGAKRAVKRLIDEYYKLFVGSSCALPEATAVNRQGVSWTIYDPEAFQMNGGTGLFTVDDWINRQNKGSFARATDPLTDGLLMSSVVSGCGEGCGDGGS